MLPVRDFLQELFERIIRKADIVAPEFLPSSALPSMIFSSRFSFLYQARILPRASLVRTIFNQSRLGPLPGWAEVSTSTISPVFT